MRLSRALCRLGKRRGCRRPLRRMRHCFPLPPWSSPTRVSRPRTVLIAGPTASGKSALALALAERMGGVIVNADSMQVYRDLRIITARPTASEEGRVPHRLYGHVDAAESYSVGRWLADARAALAEAAASDRVPILVGGTGLYFKLLTGGLAAIPS